MQATRKKKRSYVSLLSSTIPFAFLLTCLLSSTSAIGQTGAQVTGPALPAVTKNPQTPGEEQMSEQERGQIVETYRQHRLKYKKKKENITNAVEQELRRVTDKLKSLSSELEAGEAHLGTGLQQKEQDSPAEISADLQHLNKNISKYERLLSALSILNRGSAYILTPLAFMAGTHGDSIPFIFLPLTFLNIFLYLFFRQRPTFIRYKKLLIALLVTVFLACATSLLAAPMDSARKLNQNSILPQIP